MWYKVITSVLTKRLNRVIDKLVSHPQKAVIGRLIHHNIFTPSQVINSAKKLQEETLITNIDFEKAFDRVTHEFLLLVLKKIGFRERFFNISKACLSHCFSQVILPDGDFSEGYDILSGVRQGDCISPLFFVLTINMLIRAILNCREINGFKIPYHHKSILQPQNGEVLSNKIVGFADDLSDRLM